MSESSARWPTRFRPRATPPSVEALQTMTGTTLAVWGLGSIGLRHATNGLACGARVIGYDPSADRRDLLTARGGEVTEHRKDSFAQADAVLICTSSAQHLDDLKTVLSAGKSVFVEKPLADRIDGLEDMLGLAQSQGLTVATGYVFRFHPAIKRAETLLKSGAVGRVLWGRFIASSYLPDWRPHQDHRTGYAASARLGGAIFDYTHDIDLALHLIGAGELEAAVASNSSLLQIDSEDLAVIVLRHGEGAVSSLHMDYVSRPGQRRFEIAGTEGRLTVDVLARRLEHLGSDGQVIETETFGGSFDDDYVEEMEAFLQALQGSETPLAGAGAGLATLKAALSARRMCGLPQA